MLFKRPLLVFLLVAASACSIRDAACGRPGQDQTLASPDVITGGAVADPMDPGQMSIMFLGDSLTSGFGLLSAQAFPAQIQEMFANEGFSGVETINAGLSGDTTAGGLRRIQRQLDPSVRIVVVALGGNDALRGLTIAETKENLRQIIEFARGQGIQVVLCGMQAPTNLGEDYQTAFKDLYFDLLRMYQRQIVYVPFLLEGVAGHPELNQDDGIHPNEAGAKMIAELLFPQLRSLVEGMGGGGD
jgi:acyl-CoA thioesterase-1